MEGARATGSPEATVGLRLIRKVTGPKGACTRIELKDGCPGRPESRRGGNEDTELADLSLVASPGDRTSCATLEKLPDLLELPLPRG